MTKKLVMIADFAAPYNVKLAEEIQRHYVAEFWFHTAADPMRPWWWQAKLGPHSRILDNVHFAKQRRYFSLDVVRQLRRFDPDIILLGGALLPTNYVAYLWGKRHGRKVYLASEVTRSKDRKPRERDTLVQAARVAYAGLDGVLALSPEAYLQFRDVYGFGDRTKLAQYAADLGSYFKHPDRTGAGALTLLYANRLTDDYNPLAAIAIFAELRNRGVAKRLLMNASGELIEPCRAEVARLGLGDEIEFLDEIKSWDSMPDAYARADVLILPAIRSTGNFTIMEAMASGMGIVVSDGVMGNGKQVIEGHNGFSRPATVQAFADAVAEYARQPELFRAHARINREMVRKFDVPATADLWHALLENQVPAGEVALWDTWARK